MSQFHFSWLQLTILLPLIGALRIARQKDPETAQRQSVVFLAGTLITSVLAWLDFGLQTASEVADPWDWVGSRLGGHLLVMDELSAPLIPLSALAFLLTTVVTLRTKVARFSFTGTLIAESILLATLSCKNPWMIVGLLALSILPPLWELRTRGKPIAVFALHMGVSLVAMAGGWYLVSSHGPEGNESLFGVALLTIGVLIRSGVVPVHCWITDLFEHATFGTALLFVTPMAGAYAAVRLLLPVAPDWALRSIAIMSLITAVYAAAMALVQHEARRFFCYIFLSHASLVLVGLETATPIALTGALSVWLAVGLGLTGFGLALRCLEARVGRITLDDFHGLYEVTPSLANLFLLTGLASVGFPGTFGFVGTELLIDGAVQAYPMIGLAVIVAAALNGIAIMQAYFRLFGGARHIVSLGMHSRAVERLAVMTLATLIFAGGLYPQPGIVSRYHAAISIIGARGGKATTEPHADQLHAAAADNHHSSPAKKD